MSQEFKAKEQVTEQELDRQISEKRKRMEALEIFMRERVSPQREEIQRLEHEISALLKQKDNL